MSGNFLDYGAGYGFFVRLMRDSQLDFFAFDEYCTNLFAKQYQVNLKEIESIQFEMITCFEVFEHFVFPFQDIKRLLQYSPNLLFSTELVSNPPRHLTTGYITAAIQGNILLSILWIL